MSDGSYEGIAIVGMAGRFPGAGSVEELWANLVAGKESVSFFDDEELAESGLDGGALRRRGQYVSARGILENADCFDAAFFGIHPKEAEVMDPQHRVFLEACWTALERAGYAPSQMKCSVGVFGGATFNTYYLHALHPRPDLLELVGSDLVMLGNEKDYLTTRVAYKLGLKGPAVNVSTACSTSLVAVAQACQSLLTYQCDMALAGGSSVTVPQKRGYFHDEGNIGSADGHTRSFDERSSGTVFGNGVAVVVLKRLAEAVDDGDRIYAVIKAAALNNDGSQRVSFGAPGVEGQSEVVAMAHALAGVDPETITYVEAHGTATPLGDPIEVAGLTKAFRLGTSAKQFCALGSVKTNLGHLDAAAGVTGLIKVALSLHHRIIPASLHFTKANPKLDLDNSPFYVNASIQEWHTKSGIPRRAAVSSFGTGGTNAHVILEETPELAPSGLSRPWQLLVCSAKTPEALDRTTTNLTSQLRAMADSSSADEAGRALADAAFTLQTGRSEFVHRRVVACRDSVDGAAALEARDPKRVFTHQQQLQNPPVVFMFPGQGAQYPGMGAALYRSETVFREEVDRCSELLRPFLDADLRSLVFPVKDTEEEAGNRLMQTGLTQPALFAIEYALAKLWMSWGVRPTSMIGHSVGEYVAGCLAGVFSLEDALMLVARRGALVQAQPGGAMLAVRLPEKDVTPLLNGSMAIAAVNAPSLCVVAGPHEAIAALEEELASHEVVTRHLHTSHAFHSPMMDAVVAPFTELLRHVKFGEPRVPFVSNVTAGWITAAEATSPEYWASHVRSTVRFGDGVAELVKDPRNVLLEVGPGNTLSTLARQHPSKAADQVVLSTLPVAGEEEQRGILESLGRLWMTGAQVDWAAFYGNEQRRRVVLPTYPFERRRYWPEPIHGAPVIQAPAETSVAPSAAMMSVPLVATVASASIRPDVPRKERLLAATRSLLQELSGDDLSNVDPGTDFLELGLDSLLLTQAATLFQRKFGVRISFRQLMEDLNSCDAIASYLDSQMQPEAASVLTAAPSGPPSPVPAAPAVWTAPKSEAKSHGPFRRMDRGTGSALSPMQSRALDALIARYTKRTAKSKEIAAETRPGLADPRSAAGFKQAWKEMVYPIVTTRSDGSKVWDVDGNEYVDFVMGFGASLFGHRPPFVLEAVRQQLELGFEIGPIQPLAGEVAALIREFTGMERVGFTNTGSEAVLAATRVARTVTGRDKIAVFAGAYHGIFDEVLFRPVTREGQPRAAAIAPGIPESSLGQVMVLDYGNPQSLDYLRSHGSEIAAVLVEPVQSRRLDLQPREFLHELRRVTEQNGSALIFDEVVTGFRLQPGGAQAYFGVRADLATYGKVIGGGLPIGVVTGAAKFMDALDGGKWQFGDASFPEAGVTFFAGTFVRHPLALAAAKAVLTHLKEQGPGLQESLNDRTAELASNLQASLDEVGAPYHLTQFSSLIQLESPADQKLSSLLFYLLRERGIHIWDNRAFVMTTAHRQEDLRKLVGAFRESLAEMRSCEFFVPVRVPLFLGSETRPAESSGEETGAFPLTEAQKEIWLAAQMSSDAAVAYNESLRLEFSGAFDVDAFRAAAEQVVGRHPILLARLSEDGQSQCLNLGARLDVPLLDFSALADAERTRKLSEVAEGEASQPFDLITGPLLRIRVIRLGPDHHVVLWTAHHIVCDGWSSGLILSELARIYSSAKRGLQADLEPPLLFREYVRENQVDSPDARAALDYWCKQFAEMPEPLNLPADRSRPPVRTARANTTHRKFEESLHKSLKRVAAQQRTTMVVLLLAAAKGLLYRLTGQSDLVVGLGAAGQAVTDKHCLVGHCLNLLPVRTTLEGGKSFRENVVAVKSSVLNAYDHHQATIGGILQHLKVPRGLNRPPLVDVIFNVDRDPGAVEFHQLKLTVERNAKRALHYDLFFNFVESQNGLSLECDYNTDLFDRPTIDRWLNHFQTLLESIVSDSSEELDKLAILSEAERKTLIYDWNAPGVEFPPRLTLHQWFESQVKKTPDARAVTFEREHLTYSELNRRANQVAHHLIGLGVEPDTLVGLCVERSLETIIGILGILKAGGAYLPIDPASPRDRVAFMVEDACAPVLLTQSALASELPHGKSRVVCFDTHKALLDHEVDTNPARSSSPANLAYAIYTSGSTGKPKGTLVTHYNVVRLMQASERWFHFDAQDVWTFFHSHAFDFSVWEMWGALLYGGRVVMVPYLMSRSPEDFYKLLVDERVTVLNQTPSAFRQLIQAEEALDGSAELSLRYVIFGGEALPMDSLKPWFARHGDERPRLVNMYGITETTVHVTYRPLSAGDTGSGSVIGIPIPDLQIYILDAYRQPVPIGVSGEIYVGGAGVTRGYLDREELTGQKFLPDMFRRLPDARVYRSGDLARYLPNRDIEYLGRIDHQVKIRGFRIELGEIEAVLRSHELVGQCVVLARESGPSDRMLVAYFEPRPGPAPDLGALREHLKRHLPDYMVPSAFVPVERMPLTSNGKIDRAALPAPAETIVQPAQGSVGPRTETQKTLAAIWTEVLGVDNIGVNDDFFDLGGHSLLAIKAVSRIRSLFEVELSLRAFFLNSTIASLAQVLEEAQGVGGSGPRIERRRQSGPCPLSFAQERLWFLDQLAPGSAAYNIVDVIRFVGSDSGAIERALNELVSRHEALRTAIADSEGEPVQVVFPTIDLALREVDLSGMSEPEREREWVRIAREDGRRPFVLSSPPLFRPMLIHFSDQEHLLVLTLHHIIVDEWSMDVIHRELQELHASFSQGRPSPLPELLIQYADFACWQRERTQEEALERQIAYWRKELAGAPSVLELPLDKPRPVVQSFRGETESFELPKELLDSLKSLGRQEHATLFMALMTGFAALLYRYTGQDDVVVGTPISGRTRSETEGLVGFFVNTVALRTRFHDDLSFRSLLQQVREKALGAYTHQDVSFGRLVAELAPQRTPSHSPLFQVMLVLHNPEAVSQTSSVTGASQLETGTSKFDLTLFLSETEDGLLGLIEYCTDLFDRDTIRRLFGHYRTLLEAMVSRPDQRISTVPMLADAERRKMTVEWNGTRSALPPVPTLHGLFERQAEQTPDARAVTFEDRHLTYDELNRRANQLARHLQTLGAGPDVIVALCVERSIDMVVAVLAVLKAGAAYLPLDIAHPRDRLTFMLEDANAPIVLTQRRLLDQLPPHHARVVCVDDLQEGAAANLGPTATAANLAYVIYTSGSTGRPKGVLIEHQSVVNLIGAVLESPGFTDRDVMLAVTTLSFDIATAELFLPLASGGHLVVASSDAASSGVRLLELLERSGATFMQPTPVTWQMLLEAGWRGSAQLKMISTGEALPLDLAARLLPKGASLWNLYGPTETTIWSTGCQVTETTSIAIGRPIANTQAYILDAHLQPVPVGVTGELFLGGYGLARGYLNRPELTTEKFVSNPFASDGGSPRLYRTGDLARYRADGSIDCLGRIDHQVKIRGFRIELGEIEAALGRHDAVGPCVVIARERVLGEKTLVAYFEPRSGLVPETASLRTHLRKELPDYMVPSAFVPMERLPLTPNGKVDRAALPAPAEAIAQGSVGPRTEAEKTLAAIWTEVLRVENIGVNDDFFDLGGHSLLAIKAVSRIRNLFEVDLSPRTFFVNSTIGGLAKALEAEDARTGMRPIERRRQSGPCPLSFAQERLWFLDQLAPGSAAYNIVDVIRFVGSDSGAIERALNELVSRHEALRTAIADSEGEPVQVVFPTIDLALREVDLSGMSEPEREREWVRIAREDGRRPFVLSSPPLFRPMLIHFSDQEHLLVLTLHHIIVDEWSMDVIHRELQELHASFSQGRPSPLPELLIQYADFACWQRERTQEEALERQIAYWRKELAGAPSVLELPLDKPRPVVQSFRGETESFELPKELLDSLKSLGRQEHATLFMALMTGFAALLYRYTGQDDVVVGTPISGRTRSETEGLVGFFVNTVALRTRFHDDLSFRSLLQQVREKALGAYTHQDVSFGRLVAELAPQRTPSHSPLFQVMLVLHNPEAVSQTSSVTGASQLETGTSKFDLTLFLSETEDGLLGLIEYCTDLFDRDTIRRLFGHYRTLLEAMVSRPDQRISTVPMLADAERRKMTVEWNGTRSALPPVPTLHGLFERQAEQTPDARAVTFEDRHLTYDELNRRANQLARHLQTLGAGPDVIVALCVERSIDMVVAVLAVLKAGAAYLPLDIAHPRDRLTFMLEDANAPIVLTQRRLLDQLPPHHARVVCVDDLQEGAAANLGPTATAANLAYVIYTSGSTGRPKGVLIEHQSVVNLIGAVLESPGFTDRDVMLAVTTLSFDIATAELFLPLASGGHLVVASSDAASSGVRLLELLERSGATFMQPTPVTWQMLLEAGWRGSAQLKMISTGEALPLDLAARLLPKGASLWNLYGPTETTIWSTGCQVTETTSIAIGRPIANTQAYILDAHLQPVPVGVTGELFLGGYGLARGYLNRPELTTEKFVSNPFASDGGSPRLYRTGDLARYRADGSIDCLGRIDHQVKIRGFRIELGEIEAALGRHDAVGPCVVIARERVLGEKTLVAYFEPRSGLVPETASLRTHLRKELPDYMVPSAFVPMERLPLTPNGKVDRAALPSPEEGMIDGVRRSVAPRDLIEQMLAQLWSKVLHVDHVGLDDNFFELGGHSLLAVRIIVEIERLYKKRLPLSALLKAPTVRDLAEVLRRDHWTPSWSSLVPIRAGGARPPFFLLHSHGGNVLEYYAMVNRLETDQPVYALQAHGLDGRIVKDRSLEEMAAGYVHEMRGLQPEGPYFVGGFCFGGLLALEAAQQLRAAGEEVGLVVLIQTMHPTAANFKPSTPWLQRWWYRASKRIDLERENLVYRGKDHIRDRCRRMWDMGRARTEIALDRLGGTDHHRQSRSLPYILECLAIEHGKAAARYKPQPYDGDVLVFRAHKQLAGLVADSCLGWKDFLNGNLDICDVPGHQQTVLIEPNVSRLTEVLSSKLQAAQHRTRVRARRASSAPSESIPLVVGIG